MIISLIAAVTENQVIGKNNDLPWHLPDDMKYFVQTTKGHTVIMGRKNYDSLPPKFKPLKDRVNIIVSRQEGFRAPGTTVVHSWTKAVEAASAADSPDDEIFVIGGAQIYELALPTADRLYLTEIHTKIDGDTYFPAFSKHQWIEKSRTPHLVDDKHIFGFDFVVYHRKS